MILGLFGSENGGMAHGFSPEKKSSMVVMFLATKVVEWAPRNSRDLYGYGSIPINTIFRGMNIHKSQLFWCELQGDRVLTHPHLWRPEHWSTKIHKRVKKGHSSASQAGSVAHWMRRCVSDASALAEPSFGDSNPPRSDLFNFFVSQAFASCGHCPIHKPTHFRGTSQSIAGRPRRPLVKLGSPK